MGVVKDMMGAAIASSNPYASYFNAQAGAPMWAMPGKAFNAARGAVTGVGNAAVSAKNAASNAINKVRSFGKSGMGGQGDDGGSGEDPSVGAQPAQQGSAPGGQGNGGGSAIDTKTGQQIIKTLESGFRNIDQGFKSLEQVSQRASQLLDENSKENKELKEKLNEITQKQEAAYKLAQEQANQMGKKQATMSHPLSKNITTMTTLLERIARATEDSAKIAKLSAGLGMNSPIKASAIMASSGYIDPADNSSGKKKQWHSDMLQMQKDVAKLAKHIKESNDEIAEKLDNVNTSITNSSQPEKGSGLFSKLKSGVLGAGKLGLLGALLAGKATWKHVVQPAADYHITRFKVGAKAKKEEIESNALKEYAEAIKSGDQDKIKKAKIVLKKNKISDMMANFAAENKGDITGMELFMKKHKEREQAVPFDTQTRDAIITGIPLLLSEILKAISGQDKQWNYEFGRLSTTDEAIKSAKMKAQLDHVEAASKLRGNKGLLWYGKNTGKLADEVERTRKEVGTSETIAKNKFGVDGGLNISSAAKSVDQQYQEGGLHSHKDTFETIKYNNANLTKAAVFLTKTTVKATLKFVAIPIAKAMLQALCEALDASEGGRKFFNEYVKPNLPKMLNHCKSWVSIFYSVETAFPHIIMCIKQFLKDVEEGRVGIFEAVPLAIRGFLNLGDNKGNTINKAIIMAFNELKVIVKGTVFESAVNAAIDFIINKAMPILRGENQEFNEKAKRFNEKTKQIIGTSYTQMNMSEFFNNIAKGDTGEMKRLLSAAGFKPDDADKIIGSIDDLKVKKSQDNVPNLMDSLKGMSTSAQGGPVNLSGASIKVDRLEELTSNTNMILERLEKNIITIKDKTEVEMPDLMKELLTYSRSSNQSLGFILKSSGDINKTLENFNKNITVKTDINFEPLKDVIKKRETIRSYFSNSDYWDRLYDKNKKAFSDALDEHKTFTSLSTEGSILDVNIKNSEVTRSAAIPVIIAGNLLSGKTDAIPVIVEERRTRTEIVAKAVDLPKKKTFTEKAKRYYEATKKITMGIITAIGKGFKKAFDAVVATGKFTVMLGKGIYRFGAMALNFLKDGFIYLKDNIPAIFDKFVVTPLKFIGKVLHGAGIFISESTRKIGAVMSKAGEYIAVFTHKLYEAYQFTKKWAGKGLDLAKGMIAMLTNPLGWLKDKFAQMVNFIKGLFSKTLGGLWKGIKKAGKGIASFFGFGKEAQDSSNSRYLRLIAAYTKGTYDNLSIYLKSNGLTPAKLKLPPASAAGALAQSLGSAVAKTAKAVVTLGGVTSFFANSIGKMKEKARENRERKNYIALQKIAKNTDRIHSQFGKYWKWQKTKSIFGMIGGILQTGFSSLTSLLSGIFSGISSLLGSLIPGAGRAIARFGGPLIKMAAGAVGTAGKVLGNMLGFGGASGGAGAGMGKTLGSVARVGAKFLGPIGLAYTAYEAFDGAISGWKNADKIHSLKEGQEASMAEKGSAAVGGAVGNVVGGILDLVGGKQIAQMFGFESATDAITKGTAKVAKKAGQALQAQYTTAFGFLTGSGARNGVVNKHTIMGLIESNPMKIERINDYKKFETLSARDIKYMIDYGFANPQDQNFAIQLLATKEAAGEDSRGYFEAAWQDSKEWVKNKFTGAWESIKDAGNWIWDKLTSFPSLIKDALVNAWEKFKDIMPNAAAALENVWEKFKGFMQPLTDKLSNIGEFIDEKVTVVIETISGVFTTIADTVSGAIGTVTEKIGNVVSAAKDTLFGAFEKIVNFGSSLGKAVMGALGGPIESIYDWTYETKIPLAGGAVRKVLNFMGFEEYDKKSDAYQERVTREKMEAAAMEAKMQEEKNGVVPNSVDSANADNATLNVTGNMTIASIPNVFNQMLTTLKQIEANTRVSKKRSSGNSNSNSSNGQQNGASSDAGPSGDTGASAGTPSPPGPTDPANINAQQNAINAANSQAKSAADVQKGVEQAQKQANDVTISPETKQAAGK